MAVGRGDCFIFDIVLKFLNILKIRFLIKIHMASISENSRGTDNFRFSLPYQSTHLELEWDIRHFRQPSVTLVNRDTLCSCHI